MWNLDSIIKVLQTFKRENGKSDAPKVRVWINRMPQNNIFRFDRGTRIFLSGDKCEQFGVYEAACCGYEVVLIDGAMFPDCPAHKEPADWKLVCVIGPDKTAAEPAA